MQYRMLAPIFAAVALFASLSMVLAQDRRDDRDTGKGTSGVGRGSTYTGKISRVDADKRLLVLKDVHGTGAGKGGTGGTGTGGTSGTGKAGTGVGAGLDTMMVTVNRDATITLDGKKSDLRDLKEGYYARVEVTPGTGTGTGTGKGTGTSGTGTSGTGGTATEKGGTGASSRTFHASRVEAFTRNPSSTGKGGTGGTGGTGGKDR